MVGGSHYTGPASPSAKRDRFGVGRRGVVALVACALLIVGALSYIQLRTERTAADELIDRFRERAEFASDFVDTAFVQSAASVEAAARRLLARERASEHSLARFMRAAAPEDAYAVLADASGSVVATFPAGLPAEGIADTGAIEAALADGEFTGGIIETPAGPGLEVAVRFPGREGPRVIVDAIDAAPLDEFFDQFLAGVPNLDGGRGYVVDEDGEVVGSSGSERPGKQLEDHALARALEQGATTGTYGEGDGSRFVTAAIPRSNLNVVLTAPEATLLSPADAAANLGWILVGVVTLIGVAAVALLIQHLNRQRVLATAQARLHDPLTGLPNRARLTAELAAALPELNGGVLAVIAVGLDRFGRVNESLGAGTGDRVLVEVAARLTTSIGPGRTVARLGGDEFAIVLPAVEGLDDADAVIGRVQAALREPVRVDHRELVMRASFGVALATRDDERAEVVIAAAGEGLARAKRTGREIAYAEPDRREQTRRRLQLESDLRHALVRDQLAVYYQPIVALADGSITGAEALLRWEHPELGPIPPAEFIPLAEEAGLIGSLGEFVLVSAAREAADWRQGDRALTVHVNLSAKQLVDPALYLAAADALAESRLDPDRLYLEVTETAILEDPQLARQHLEELRRLGVHLSLDDFGVGYSSLRHIAELAPIEQVKIDRSFVARLAEQREGAIIASVASLCEDLGLDTVAEGVETSAQSVELHAMNVRKAQGFHFARPAPAAVIEATLGLIPSG